MGILCIHLRRDDVNLGFNLIAGKIEFGKRDTKGLTTIPAKSMYFTHYWQIIFQQQNHNSAVELGWKRSLCLAGFQNHPGDKNCFESEAGLPQGFPGCTGQDARLVAPLPLPMPSRPATKPGESSLGRNKPTDTLSPFRAQLLLFPFFCWSFFKYTGNIFSYWSICDESKPLFKRNANSETSRRNKGNILRRKYVLLQNVLIVGIGGKRESGCAQS